MDATAQNISQERIMDFLVMFLNSLYLYCTTVGERFKRRFRQLCENDQIVQMVNAINQKFAQHPLLRHLALATSLTCAIPVIMFVAFAIVSIVVTFSGFLFIEGTILAFGGICMFLCLTMMVLVMSVMALALAVFYLLVQKLGILLNRLDHASGFWANLSRRERLGSFALVGPHQE